MANFKPEIFYYHDTMVRTFGAKNYSTVAFPTYRELKRNLKEHLSKSNGEVTVTRSLRGQWGEWIEKWQLRRGKPTKVNEFWM